MYKNTICRNIHKDCRTKNKRNNVRMT